VRGHQGWQDQKKDMGVYMKTLLKTSLSRREKEIIEEFSKRAQVLLRGNLVSMRLFGSKAKEAIAL